MRAVSLTCFAFLALGCSAVINPDGARLGDPIDGGADRPPPRLLDSGMGGADAGPGGGVDADRPPPPPVDADVPPRVDAGNACGRTPRCEGDVRLYCEAGEPLAEDCQAVESYCADGACVPWRCTPGQTRCTDGGGSLECDARGTDVSFTSCPDGCDPDTGRCRTDVSPPDPCGAAEAISVGGDDEVDLCGIRDGADYQPGGDCGSGTADTGEQVYELTIEERQAVEIEAFDVDESAAIDTVVYLRATCDAPDSQLACGDDVPCGTADLPGGIRCIGGEELRQSRIQTVLDPGTYYLFVDAHDYATSAVRYGCGRVRVEVHAAGTDVTPGGG